MAEKYAMCKYGPLHRFERCTYCHCLDECVLPLEIPSCLWTDESDVPAGSAGIDFFVGQHYTSSQMQRIRLYISNVAKDLLPMWARMAAWFFKIYPEHAFVYDGVFSWDDVFPRVVLRSCSSVSDVFILHRPAGLHWAVDADGSTFLARLQRRRLSAQSFRVYQATADVNIGSFRAACGQKCLRIHVSDDGLGLYLVPLGAPFDRFGGWTSAEFFQSLDESRVLHEVSVEDMLRRGGDHAYVLVHPVTTPAQSGSRCCDVFHDGSVAGIGHHGQGIAAGWIFPSSFVCGSASLACGCTGSGAGELLGVGHPEMYSLAGFDCVCGLLWVSF